MLYVCVCVCLLLLGTFLNKTVVSAGYRLGVFLFYIFLSHLHEFKMQRTHIRSFISTQHIRTFSHIKRRTVGSVQFNFVATQQEMICFAFTPSASEAEK